MKNINIETEVKKEVFTRFEKGEKKYFEEGRGILRQLAFHLSDDKSTEEKRMVLYNLAWVNDYLGDKNAAKFHIKNIKNIVENDVEYINSNKIGYSNVLSLYRDLFQDEITLEDQIRMEVINKRVYAEENNILCMLICDFNIAKLEKNLEMMIWSIESLHIQYLNVDNKEEKEKYNKVISQLKTELIDIDADAYQELMDTIEDNLASISPEARAEGVY